MKPKYVDFFLIVSGIPDDYTVEAQGPGDIRVPPLPFAFQMTDDLGVELNRIKMGFAPSRERMQKVGEMLFKALLPYEIIPAFTGAKTSLPEGVNLRIKLIVRPAELSHLPWELTYDILNGTFLASRSTHPIVRYIEQGLPPASLLSRRPLRVLYVQANPQGTTLLDTAASEKELRQALGDDGQVTAVRNTTPGDLRNALREGSFHILHYDGHGSFEGQSGYLYLHDAQGAKHKLSGEMLATYLDGSSIRLVVLSACETAADSQEKRFSGIAQQLMRTTLLPAVVAMQYEIQASSAAVFSREFYRALVDDYPVDAAVVEGRKAILELFDGDPFAHPDWATPVLFMRVKDGDILAKADEATRDDHPIQEAVTKHVTVSGSQIGVLGNGAQVKGGIHFHQPVSTGDTFNMSGDFRGAILNIKATLKDVRQSVGAMPHGDALAKAELQQLIDQLSEALEQAPPAKADEAEAVAETAKDLVEKATAEKPNRTMLRITGEGLKAAAQNLASAMPSVLTIATQVVDTVTRLIP